MQRDQAAHDSAITAALARCIRRTVCADDGRTVAGAAHGALLALGVAEPLRGRMVDAALRVADGITQVVQTR